MRTKSTRVPDAFLVRFGDCDFSWSRTAADSALLRIYRRAASRNAAFAVARPRYSAIVWPRVGGKISRALSGYRGGPQLNGAPRFRVAGRTAREGCRAVRRFPVVARQRRSRARGTAMTDLLRWGGVRFLERGLRRHGTARAWGWSPWRARRARCIAASKPSIISGRPMAEQERRREVAIAAASRRTRRRQAGAERRAGAARRRERRGARQDRRLRAGRQLECRPDRATHAQTRSGAARAASGRGAAGDIDGSAQPVRSRGRRRTRRAGKRRCAPIRISWRRSCGSLPPIARRSRPSATRPKASAIACAPVSASSNRSCRCRTGRRRGALASARSAAAVSSAPTRSRSRASRRSAVARSETPAAVAPRDRSPLLRFRRRRSRSRQRRHRPRGAAASQHDTAQRFRRNRPRRAAVVTGAARPRRRLRRSRPWRPRATPGARRVAYASQRRSARRSGGGARRRAWRHRASRARAGLRRGRCEESVLRNSA